MNLVMIMKKTNGRKALLLALFIFAANFAYAAPKIVVGANLNEYKSPRQKECDIVVSQQQYPTIQTAIDVADIGDRVCVNNGEYNEDVLVNKVIRLSGQNPKKTIINGQTPNGNVLITADNVVIEGFTINGVGSDYGHAALIIGEGLTNVFVQYNHIKADNGTLALRAGGQGGHLIQHNILEGNNSPQIALVNGQPSVGKPSNDIKFLNNTFTGTVNPTLRDDTGVVLISQATNNVIQRNVFDVTGALEGLITCAYGSNEINENNLNSDTFSHLTNTPVKVRAGYDSTTNAENNWWGDLDPSDNIQGDIDFTPFVTKPLNQTQY